MAIVGLDLAGVESKPTGLCIFKGWTAETLLVYSNEEIVRETEGSYPRVVAIDAPLSLPEGRKSVEQRSGIHLRECDEELLKRGIRFFPVTLGPMRKLTSRGIDLRGVFESKRLNVVEVYPGGAQDVLGIPRKQQGLRKLKAGLEEQRVKGLSDEMSDHELDAVTCALVGKLFLEGKTVIYGSHGQTIVMPNDKDRGLATRAH